MLFRMEGFGESLFVIRGNKAFLFNFENYSLNGLNEYIKKNYSLESIADIIKLQNKKNYRDSVYNELRLNNELGR